MENRHSPLFQDFAPYAFLASTRKASEYMLFLHSEFPAGFNVIDTDVKYQKSKTKVTVSVVPVPTRPGEVKRSEWAGKFKLTPKDEHADFNPAKTVVEITVSVKRNALRIPNFQNTLSYTDCNADPIPAAEINGQKALNCPYIYLAVPPTNGDKKHPANFAYEPNMVMFVKDYELAKADEINTLSSPRNGVFETLIILKEKPGNEETLKGIKLKPIRVFIITVPATAVILRLRLTLFPTLMRRREFVK